jgi:hypothetical protein
LIISNFIFNLLIAIYFVLSFFLTSSFRIWFNLIFISTLILIFFIVICFSPILFLIEIFYPSNLIFILLIAIYFIWNNLYNYIIFLILLSFNFFYLSNLFSVILIIIYFIWYNLLNYFFFQFNCNSTIYIYIYIYIKKKKTRHPVLTTACATTRLPNILTSLVTPCSSSFYPFPPLFCYSIQLLF